MSCNLALPFVWTTNEGAHIPITQMDTVHLFNTMKMMFNHLADNWGADPVWFNKQWNGAHLAARRAPKETARVVLVMLAELDRRTDLPERYETPLALIRNQIYQARLPEGT